MHYKLILLASLLIASCTSSETINSKNSFYITYHTTDSLLKNNLILSSRNKVSYYDSAARLFRIIPINYKTDDFDDMHYFLTEDQFSKQVKEGMVMYDIEIKESVRYDSTSFSIKKMVFNNNAWNFKSDMGWINVYFPAYSRAIKEKKIRKLSEYIIQSIAKDSYTF